MQDLLVLWDAIFSDGVHFDLVDYIFVAMLAFLREACRWRCWRVVYCERKSTFISCCWMLLHPLKSLGVDAIARYSKA